MTPDRARPAGAAQLDAESLGHRQRRDRDLRASMLSGVCGKLLISLFSLCSVGISARAIGGTEFGVLATLSALTGLMAFADFGIGSGLMTSLAVAAGRDDVINARIMVSTACFTMAGIGAIVSVLGVLAALSLPWDSILGAHTVEESALRAAVAIFFVFVGLGIPSGLGQRTLVGHQKGMTANIWFLAAALLGLFATAGCAALDAPLWCFVMAATGVPVMVALFQSVLVFTRTFHDLRPALGLVSMESFRSLAGISSMFFGLNVAVAIAYQSDAIIVASTLGAGPAAILAVAIRLFTLIGGTLGSASQQMWTSMAEALARGDADWVRSRLTRIVVGSALISVPASALLVLFGPHIARWWVGEALVPSRTLMSIIAIWTVYVLAMSQIALFLNAAQVVGAQLLLALLMTVANLVISIALSKHIGMAGPVLGSLISHIISTGIPSIFLVRKAFRRLGEVEVA